MTDKKSDFWIFTLTVLLIYPLPQLAIDMYLPSWPSMVAALHTKTTMLQGSLTIYILFLGIAQLFYGPLSDKIGRRPTLLVGCSIFFFSSIAAIFTNSIYTLLFFRALQGLGMGCGFAVASAILSDVFSGNRLAKVTSHSAMVYSLSAILAPVVGGYIQYYFGWHGNFLVMALYALTIIALIYFFVFETNKQLDSSALLPGKVAKNYIILLRDFSFMGNVICLTLVFGIMIAFNIVSPFLLQNVLHISALTYGKLLLLVGLSYFLGSTVNGRLLNSFNINILVIFGLAIIFFSSFGLLVSGLMNWFSVSSVIFSTCLVMFGIGLVFPNCFANALGIFPGKGSAGAFIGSAGLVGTSVISVWVTQMHVQNEIQLSYIYLVLVGLSAVVYFFTKRVQVEL